MKFYTHLIEIESLIIELDSLKLSEQEKHHLAELVDSTLHHSVLDVILGELSDSDKKIFLQHLKEDDHDKIWQFLNTKSADIETKIKKTAQELKEKLHSDIKEIKK